MGCGASSAVHPADAGYPSQDDGPPVKASPRKNGASPSPAPGPASSIAANGTLDSPHLEDHLEGGGRSGKSHAAKRTDTPRGRSRSSASSRMPIQSITIWASQPPMATIARVGTIAAQLADGGGDAARQQGADRRATRHVIG